MALVTSPCIGELAAAVQQEFSAIIGALLGLVAVGTIV